MENVAGNLLTADVEAIVNTVNTVGVMGKGIALQFRKAYPENYKAYKAACDADEVMPGKMFVFQTGRIENPRIIINFPTKRHWKGKTRIEDIKSGLVDLVSVITTMGISSIAVPPLGCGNGGLNWSDVRPIIEEALQPLQEVRVLLYEPTGAPAPDEQVVASERPKMTPGRAVLLAALDVYKTDPGIQITLLVIQKMSYLLQAAGQPLRLNFVKGKYGPYAEALNHVLVAMDGHFITGYGDRTTSPQIELNRDAVEEAWVFLRDDPDTRQRIDRVYDLINGFESPLGLELLTTVHWTAHKESSSTPDEALTAVGAWTERKARMFQGNHVQAAWERLADEDWIPA